MSDRIGESAGIVWEYLEDYGEATGSGLARGTGLTQKQVDRAIGWLAREGKISIQKSANKEVLSLVRDFASM
jgi:transcription initiation factor IIE alpha subunit